MHLHIIAFFFKFSIFSFYKTLKLSLSPFFSLFSLIHLRPQTFLFTLPILLLFLQSFFIFHHFVRHFYSGSHINSQHISNFFRFTYDVFILSLFNTLVIPRITIPDTYIFFSLDSRNTFDPFLNALCKPTLMLHWYPSFYILFTLSYPTLTLLFFLPPNNVIHKYFFSLLIPQRHSLFTRVAHKLSTYFDFFRFLHDVFILYYLNTLVIPRITICDTYIFFR
jgi:hypothetical protein